MTSTLTAVAVVVVLALAGTAAARSPRAHPFRGEYAPVANLDALVAKAKQGNARPLVNTLLRDPHLAALDAKLDLKGQIARAGQGRFNASSFLRQGRSAIRTYVQQNKADLSTAFRRNETGELEHLLYRKLWSLAGMLSGAACQGGACAAPVPSRQVKQLFGRKAATVGLEPVPGLRLVHGDRGALARYGWQLGGRAGGGTATARVEVGRAVFMGDVDLDPRTGATTPAVTSKPAPGKIRTQPINKGVGPTRYAGNTFSARTSGVFTLMQGEQDVKISRALKQGGVPVYQPDGLLALPYWDWHPKMGWRPMAVYARVPQENLRVSDLRVLPTTKRREVVTSLRGKIAAAAGLPESQVSDLDVARFFVSRMGRIAGLFEGGRTFGGKRFLHGMLHVANVSLLGEMVDFSESPGFFDNKSQLRRAFRDSIYRKPNHNWPVEFSRATKERTVFEFVIAHFLHGVTPALRPDQRPPDGLMRGIFQRAFREGLQGQRADNARDLLDAARRPL